MKRITMKQLLAISTLALTLPFSALSHADAGKQCHKQGHKYGYKHDFSKSSSEMRHSGIPHHLRALDLTQDQQDKIFAIQHEQAPINYTQHNQQRKTLEALRTLAQADKLDEAQGQQLTDQLGKLERDKALNRLKTEARITALLTPEQRVKMREFKSERHHGEGMGKPARYKQQQTPAVKPINS